MEFFRKDDGDVVKGKVGRGWKIRFDSAIKTPNPRKRPNSGRLTCMGVLSRLPRF